MSLRRRTVLGLGLAAATAGLTACKENASDASPAVGDPSITQTPRSSPASAPTGAEPSGGVEAFGPARNSTSAAPSAVNQAPYEPKLTQTLKRYLKPTPENPKHPGYAGAVALAMVNGNIVAHAAVGEALRYDAGPVLLPADKRVAMWPDSIFDLASITKVHVAILALQQVDKGRIDLAAPVVEYLPEFTGAGKADVTVSMLLTHTSGLPVGAKVTGYSNNEQRWAAVMATPLASGAVPGKAFRYSSVGLMVLGKLIEKVTGQSLDQALKTGLTDPLGLRYTGFTPNKWLSAADKANLLVATDARTSRGLLRGVVHDDVANHLGGIAGHAGLFSTAKEVAIVGQMLLNGGTYGGKRILAEATVQRMLTNANTGLPAIDPERPNRSSAHGLGVVLDQPWFMGKLSSAAAFGHTGFTGTSLLVDPRRKLVLVLLTNRAHPNWSWANPDPTRVAVANVVASALKAPPCSTCRPPVLQEGSSVPT